MFWINWGWSNGYENDLYELGDLTPSNHNYNRYQGAIFNLEPIRDVGVEQPYLPFRDLCSGTSSLSISATEGATHYDWTTTSGTITGTGTTATLITDRSCTVCVSAINAQCNLSSDYYCQSFSVTASNLAQPNTIYCTGSHCDDDVATYYISPVFGATFYEWTISGSATIEGSGTDIDVRAQDGYYVLSVRAGNSCGYSPLREKRIYVDCFPIDKKKNNAKKSEIKLSETQFFVYPNPVQDELNVRLSTPEMNFKYQIISLQGNIICSGTASGNYKVINKPEIPSGLYILQITTDKQTYSTKVQFN